MLPPANQFWNGTSYGTNDFQAHEYVIDSLNQYITIQHQLYQITFPLAYPTAIILDVAATQLVNKHQAHPLQQNQFPGGGMFSQLSRAERLRTLYKLENLDVG